MLEVREIYPRSPAFEAAEGLYAASDIARPEEVDVTVGVFSSGEVIGCGSLKGDVLVGFVISPKAQGEGLLPLLCTELINRGIENGRSTFSIFTKPDKAFLFAASGFKQVAATASVALLEWGKDSIDGFTAALRRFSADKPDNAACVVMNANPFTLGHRYLVEKAAGEHPWLYILAVEEDKSVFPFAARLDLIKKGTADLSNVSVLPGGKYVISLLTFPTYFIKDQDPGEVQSELDLRIFGRYIAPALKVHTRLVGMEPYCMVTASYNAEMKRILPQYGLVAEEIERKPVNETGGPDTADGQAFISASGVRRLLAGGDMEAVKALVPETTFAFLHSPAGKTVREKIVEEHAQP